MKYLMLIPSLMLFLSPWARAQISPTENRWLGDLRYRFDNQMYESTVPEKSEQQRLRARLAVQRQISEIQKFEIRMATGTGRISTNQTIGGNDDSQSNDSWNLDRASFTLIVAPETQLTVGRMANTFYLVGSQDLLWDLDLNFDGISAQYSTLDSKGWAVSASRFLIDAQTASESAVYLNSLQAMLKHTFTSEIEFTVSLGAHQFQSLKDHTGLVGNPTSGSASTGKNPSQICGLNSCYSHDYEVTEIGFEAKLQALSQAFILFANYASNQSVSSENDGYIVGFKVNKLKKKEDWSIAYDFRSLEKSSAVGAFTDGESFGGGVNGTSHRLNLGYQFGENWSIAGTIFSGKSQIAPSESELARERYLADALFSF